MIAERIESPLAKRLEAVALLAALAGVGLAADPVHRHRQRGVRLAADRAEAHRAGREALHDLARRLDLLERHRRSGRLELQQAADGQQPPALVVDARREGAILVGQIAAHRMLQVGDGVEGPGMGLAVDALGVEAADVEALDRSLISANDAGARLRGDLVDADALDHRRGAGEIFVDELLDRPIASKIWAPQ